MKLFDTLAVASSLTSVTAISHNYTSVTGFFLQDDNSTNSTTFDYSTTNLGLINRTYPSDCTSSSNLTQWQRFSQHLFNLNLNSPSRIQYKLLILARHAEGYHNAAESYYGTPAWNCYWSLLNGNSTSTWADASLTPAGIASALTANRFWNHSISLAKIPLPQRYYTSPLQRCLQTANLTFGNLSLPAHLAFRPVIKEFLREGISLHTCDRRHNKTFIAQTFPFRFEEGFAESDKYWTGVRGETNAAQDVRSKTVLDDIFADSASVVSVTSHGGEIASLLRVLGHRVFGLGTGQVIPVLVRAERMADGVTSTPTFTVSPHCTVPPVTSLSTGENGGCVCPSSAAAVTTPLITIGAFKRDL